MIRQSEHRWVLGIDPGLSGALCWLCPHSGKIVIEDMPRVVTRTGKREKKGPIDLYTLGLLIGATASRTAVAVIESNSPRKEDAERMGSLWKFAHSCGAAEMAVAGYLIPLFPIAPSVWKMLIGVSADKSTSLVKARQLFPNQAHYFKRKSDDGRAEAALLAWIAKERFFGG